MARNDGSNGLGQKGLPLPSVGRPVVHSTQGVISSGHYLTSMAGMRMLLTGGNAFDAAVAASFAAAVVEPMAAYSLAAEGVFMLHHAGSGKLLSLSGQGTAPAKATAGFFRSQGLERIPTGPGRNAHLSFTVPASWTLCCRCWKTTAPSRWARRWRRRFTTPSGGFPTTSTCSAG